MEETRRVTYRCPWRGHVATSRSAEYQEGRITKDQKRSQAQERAQIACNPGGTYPIISSSFERNLLPGANSRVISDLWTRVLAG